MGYTAGITPPNDYKYSSGIGYIALPSDVDRDAYLRDCYQNNRVTIHTEHDGYINRVLIDAWDINFIEFPKEFKKLGTPVVYITEPVRNQSIIIGILAPLNQVGSGKENLFRLYRKANGNLVEISGNPVNGFLNLIVNTETGSTLNVSVLARDKKGKLNISVLGDLNAEISGNTSFQQNGKFYSKTYDGNNAKTNTELIQTKDSVAFNTPKFIINSGKENFVLGQKLKKFMDDFINELSLIKTTTMLGLMPTINVAQIALYRTRLDEFLSSIGYIDK